MKTAFQNIQRIDPCVRLECTFETPFPTQSESLETVIDAEASLKKEFLIDEITNSQDSVLSQAIFLLQNGLLPHEVDSEADLRKSIENQSTFFPDSYHMLTLKQDKKILGVSVGYYIAEVNIGFISYVVVEKDSGRLGLGKILRTELLRKFGEDAQNAGKSIPFGYIGEVKDNNPWLQMLIRNYKVTPFDLPYMQPPMREGDAPSPLVLYFQKHPEFAGELDNKMVLQSISAIYRKIYDIKNPENCDYFQKIKTFLEES